VRLLQLPLEQLDTPTLLLRRSLHFGELSRAERARRLTHRAVRPHVLGDALPRDRCLELFGRHRITKRRHR
tara:strand:- start:17 stop:229 length:213 start_codon:yes stop_codon:yes gene_type:complete